MDTVSAIIETPRASPNRYVFDRVHHAFRLERHLQVSMVYPSECGFIPETLAADGGPLGVLVLTAYPTFPGCQIEVRILAMCTVTNEQGSNVTLLGVPTYDATWSSATDVTDVPRRVLERIAHFFTTYKDLDEGEWSKAQGWAGRIEALKELESSRSRFTRSHP